MNNLIKNFETQMKAHVDDGATLAESFLKTFANEDLEQQKKTMNRILSKYAIQGFQSFGDYYFADGSRLSIDPIVDSMLATKSPITQNKPRPLT